MLRLSFVRYLLLLAALTATPALAARTILVFGDSLSAAYGIRQEAGWPSLLAERLQKRSFDYNVVNASISGETTSGGRARIEAALKRHSPRIVIIALGANDGLRGTPLPTMRQNLLAMIDAAQRKKIRVLLVGQRLPPNYGAYAEAFDATFAEVAKARRTGFVDFLLEGVAMRRELFQPDNLHPTAEAQPILLDNVWRGLVPLLQP